MLFCQRLLHLELLTLLKTTTQRNTQHTHTTHAHNTRTQHTHTTHTHTPTTYTQHTQHIHTFNAHMPHNTHTHIIHYTQRKPPTLMRGLENLYYTTEQHTRNKNIVTQEKFYSPHFELIFVYFCLDDQKEKIAWMLFILCDLLVVDVMF